MNMMEEALLSDKSDRQSKIFISHSSEDQEYVKAFVELLETIGLGAAWILQSEYLSVMLPGFHFHQIKGAVNAGRIAIELNQSVS